MARSDQPARGNQPTRGDRTALDTEYFELENPTLDSVLPGAEPLAGMESAGRDRVAELADRAAPRLTAWAAGYPILADVPAAANRLAWIALYWANALPHGPTDVIDCSAAFTTAVFGLDDVMDGVAGTHSYADLEALSGRCRRIPLASTGAAGPTTSAARQVIAAFEDCFRRLSTYPAYLPLQDFLSQQWNRCHEAMLKEARWRLAMDPVPAAAEYLSNGASSMSLPFIHGTLAAMTDSPALTGDDLRRYEAALRSGALAVRLANDMRTYERERREGTPNAVALLVRSGEPVRDALLTIRRSLDAALADLDAEIATLPSSLAEQGTALRRGVRFACHWYLAQDTHSVSEVRLRHMVSGQQPPEGSA